MKSKVQQEKGLQAQQDSAPDEPNEIDLPRLSAEARKSMFELHVQVHYRDIYRSLLRRIGNPYEAEELTQETFLRAYQAMQDTSAKPIRKVKPWLKTIALRLLIDKVRKFQRTPTIEFHDFWSDEPFNMEDTMCEGPEEALILSDRFQEIREYIKQLPEKYQTVAKLRLFFDLSNEEIAQLLGKPLSRVRPLVAKSMEQLRNVIKEKEQRN